ncbi:MAG: hypothetical protein P4L84_29950 [Isosphaeraceae bacterium]|nr:hypothetical protein [Isosphaeraceae bacterium]
MAGIEQSNDLLRVINGHIVRVLNHTTHQDMPADCAAWSVW